MLDTCFDDSVGGNLTGMFTPKDLLLKAINKNEVTTFFQGMNGYRIQGMNGDPMNVFMQDYGRAVWSFQELFKEGSHFDIPSILQDNIDRLLQSSDPFDIYTSLMIIDAQIGAEASRLCCFKLKNLDALLQKLQKNLLANKTTLENIIFQGEELTVWELANHINEINKKYNRKTIL